MLTIHFHFQITERHARDANWTINSFDIYHIERHTVLKKLSIAMGTKLLHSLVLIIWITHAICADQLIGYLTDTNPQPGANTNFQLVQVGGVQVLEVNGKQQWIFLLKAPMKRRTLKPKKKSWSLPPVRLFMGAFMHR